MKNIILYHHLGLGDHFVCNGLVHYVSKQYDSIYLPCKTSNYPTVKYLYSESPKVKVFKIDKDEFFEVKSFSSLMNLKILMVGFEKCDIKNWDKSFYSQLNINFNERYNSFYLPKNNPDKVLDPVKEEYILVHNQSSVCKYDLKIDTNLKVIEIENGISDNLFYYIDTIYNAKEIHCINSSVFHLIDSLSDLKGKLFYHDIRRTDESKFEVSSKWKIVAY